MMALLAVFVLELQIFSLERGYESTPDFQEIHRVEFLAEAPLSLATGKKISSALGGSQSLKCQSPVLKKSGCGLSSAEKSQRHIKTASVTRNITFNASSMR